jgi:hypothetical protein
MYRKTVCQLIPPNRVEVRLMATGLVDRGHVDKTGRNLIDGFEENQKSLVISSFC